MKSRGMFRVVLAGIVGAALLSCEIGQADEVLPSVSERYTKASGQETPDFQRHVVPLLGKLGCNGRACHGSFQGRGDFRLSLFGYDFEMDHQNLADRIDTAAPAESYAIQKALLQEPHEGGRRFADGSWEHQLLLKWITDGANPRPKDAAALVRLDVTPAEVIYQQAGEQTQLRAVAVWQDGTQEDVTCLCRFQTNDEAIVEVTPEGRMTSGDVGDTHVVVFYDNAVIPVPVIRPFSNQAGKLPSVVAGSSPIDLAVQEKLAKLGIVPSDLCDDSEFLRRVNLDIAGTLPTAKEVREFLADPSPEKRRKKVDQLLETPAYAAWWTTKICDWTGNNDVQLVNANPVSNRAGSQDWYDWIYRRVADNVPYDELVEGIVVAESRRRNEKVADYYERMSDYYRNPDQSYADAPGLMYYWGRTNFRTDEDRAIGFAYTFMGTRIQCAQCHKHPFDVWTQEDFQQFEKFFTRVRFIRNGGNRQEYQTALKDLGIDPKANGNEVRRAVEQAIKKGETIPFPEIAVSTAARGNRGNGNRNTSAASSQKARLLGSREVDLARIADPRVALMDWLRNDSKQLFARSLVNRVWASYFHRGIVEPTDDLSLANPPSNQALLDYLTQGFVENGYDLKWLHREICSSDTYQRSWRPNETNAQDERNFSRAVPRRLPAEVAYDALMQATASDKRAEQFGSELKGRAVAIPGVGRNPTVGPNYALTVFGRSSRTSNCDCDRAAEASLLQVIFTRNDSEVHSMISRRDGWVAQLTPAAGSSNSTNSTERSGLERQLQRAEANLKEVRSTGSDARVAAAERRVRELSARLKRVAPREDQQSQADPDNNQQIETIVEEAYLRTLSRLPNDRERQIAGEFITTADSLAQGTSGLLWTLVNTKEFIVNH